MTTTTAKPSYDPNAHYEVKVFDVEYRRDGDDVWLARIFQPQGAGPFPTLLDVHGGAWANGDRLMNEGTDIALAESGIVDRGDRLPHFAERAAPGRAAGHRLRDALAQGARGRLQRHGGVAGRRRLVQRRPPGHARRHAARAVLRRCRSPRRRSWTRRWPT